MSVWSTYEARFSDGEPDMDPKRNSAKAHLRDRMRRKIVSSLSYKKVRFNGKDMSLAILDATNDFSTKKIYAMPGEELPHGSVIEWEDSFWLITEADPHNEFCAEGKMRRCNYYLKWLNAKGDVVGRWCVVEDGTKYLIGEKTGEVLSIGDARLAVTVGKDPETDYISRGMRFLIDDMDSRKVLAYEVTKSNKLFNVFNGKGVFRFILNESQSTDYDNIGLRIADYYNWKPDEERDKPDVRTDKPLSQIVQDAKDREDAPLPVVDGKKVWL